MRSTTALVLAVPLLALAVTGCSAAAAPDCSTLPAAFASAKGAYTAERYGEASRLFESVSDRSIQCTRSQPYTNTGREFIGYEMLVAGESAHWDRQDARARRLVTKAKAMFLALHPIARHDHDLAWTLAGVEREADRDLHGTWTLGVQ